MVLFKDGEFNGADADVLTGHFEGQKVKIQGQIAWLWLKLKLVKIIKIGLQDLFWHLYCVLRCKFNVFITNVCNVHIQDRHLPKGAKTEQAPPKLNQPP